MAIKPGGATGEAGGELRSELLGESGGGVVDRDEHSDEPSSQLGPIAPVSSREGRRRSSCQRDSVGVIVVREGAVEPLVGSRIERNNCTDIGDSRKYFA